MIDPPLPEWAAYQFDRAVIFFGNAIENALLDRVTVGVESVQLYTIEKLLDPDFRLPHKHPDGGQMLTTPLKFATGVVYDEVM